MMLGGSMVHNIRSEMNPNHLIKTIDIVKGNFEYRLYSYIFMESLSLYVTAIVVIT